MFKRNFLKNDWARIPFSVIGIFLIFGSSFTTLYVTQLEEQNSVEISSTLDFNEVESLVSYVEADIARSLNYAACSAFEEIGKNPVQVLFDEGSDYDLDATGDGSVDVVDANLNIVRFQTTDSFNDYLTTNYMKGRYVYNEYIVNVVEPVQNWEDIDVEIINMELDRSLDRPIDKPKSSYRTYPVFSTTLNLEVKKIGSDKEIFTKQVNIGTIINSRYLLLEDVTSDFADRLDGTTSALGIDVLAGAMGLTWLRGYSQYALNTPNNIISNEWIAILTNGGILLEEGFVFNSADAMGIVYVGYETAVTVSEELGYDLGDKFESLKNKINNPSYGTDYGDTYKESFNDMLPNSEMKDSVTGDLDSVQTSYTADFNTSNLCEEEFNNLLEGQTIPRAIKKIYRAIIKILTERTETYDNYQEIQSNISTEKTDSMNYEESRENDAEANVNLPAGWHVTKVVLESSSFYDESETKDGWDLVEQVLISDSGFFDNSNLDFVILDGEQWRIKKERELHYSWNVETNWKVYAENETDSDVFSVTLESSDYNYDDMHKKDEDVTIKFVTEEYSNGLADLDKNSIIDAFEHYQYSGFTQRDDPNLDGALDYYLDANHLNWDSSFRENILKDDNQKYTDGSYNNELTVSSTDESKLHRDWLDLEILTALKYVQSAIIGNVTAQSTVGEGTMPDELVSDATSKLLNSFLMYKPTILSELNNKFIESGLYKGTASKTVYYISNYYLDAVEDRLTSESTDSADDIEGSTDDAINEHNDADSDYNSIKSDMSDAQMLSGISIPIGATMTLTHRGGNYDTWSEDICFSIKQNPPYFKSDYYDESPLDSKHFDNYIKYRNLNIFSPMAGVSEIIDEGFDALNDQVLTSLDSGFEELHKISDQTIRAQLEQNLNSIVSDLTTQIESSLGACLEEEQGYFLSNNDLLSRDEIDNVVSDVLNQYSGDTEEFASKLDGDEIKNIIADELEAKVQENIIAKFGADYPYISDLQDSASETITSQVTTAYDKAVTRALVCVEDKIKDTYSSFSENIEGKIQKKVSTSLSKIVPTGLPILPPFGWWVTINAWYIEVEGEIPEFKVIDSSNEAFVDPLLGHNSQEYNRVFEPVFIDTTGDGFKDQMIGANTPITFSYNTGTFIIVPPGKSGVGDRSDGMDETDEYGSKSDVTTLIQ